MNFWEFLNKNIEGIIFGGIVSIAIIGYFVVAIIKYANGCP